MGDVHAAAGHHRRRRRTRPGRRSPRARAARSSTASGSSSTATPRPGGRSDLHFTFTDAATGRPVDDLQPYLAAAGHIVVMRADGQTFAHEHAEVTDARGRPVFALPGQTFGPELDVHAEFPTAGTYQLWAPVPPRRRRRHHRPVHRPGPLTEEDP